LICSFPNFSTYGLIIEMAHATCGPHLFKHSRTTWFGHGKHDLKTKENENKTTKIGLMEVCLNCHGHENNQVYKISWIKTRTKVGLPKSKSWKKKNNNKNTNATQEFNKILLQEQKIRKKKDYDNKTCPKLMLNTLKVRENSTFIIPIGHLIQKNFSKKFQSICGPYSPMCAHVHLCVN